MPFCKHLRQVRQRPPLPFCQPQLRGYENRLSEIKGCCGEKQSWQWRETRWRRISLKFYSHLAPSSPGSLSAHGSPHCHRNFPFNHNRNLISVSRQRVLIACRERERPPASAIFKAHLFSCRLYLPLPTHRVCHPFLSSTYKHIFHLCTHTHPPPAPPRDTFHFLEASAVHTS